MPLVKSPRTRKKIKYILIILIVLCILLSFRPVAQGVADGIGTVLNKPAEWKEDLTDTFVEVAKTGGVVLVGLAIVAVGAWVGLTVLGVAVVVIGLGLIAWSIWNWLPFNSKPEKPDNVSLGGPL